MMDNFKEISFCDKIAYNLYCNNQKKNILDKLHTWGLDINTKNYVPFEKKHMSHIIKNPYLISIKSVGNAYFLYLTNINGINLSFFVDKKIIDGYNYPRIIMVRYRFKENLYQNDTIFSGELVKTKNNWKFILSDLHVVSGNKVNYNIIKKISKIKNILFNNYVYDPYMEPCILKVKKFFAFDKKNLGGLLEHISILDYKITSLIITPAYYNSKSYLFTLKANYDINKIENQTPIKPKKILDKKNVEPFANFLMTKTMTPGIYQLFCQKNGQIYKHSIARISGLECIEFIKNNFKNKNDKLMVYCEYSYDFGKFTPKKLSKKKKPDDYNTIIQITQEKNI